jgi:hypothetical protein
MALYLISYDIADKDAFEYQNLWNHLEEMGAIKILYSEWAIVQNTGQASSIYSEIAPLTLKTDRLLVQELTKDAYWDKLLIENDVFNQLLTNARG